MPLILLNVQHAQEEYIALSQFLSKIYLWYWNNNKKCFCRIVMKYNGTLKALRYPHEYLWGKRGEGNAFSHYKNYGSDP